MEALARFAVGLQCEGCSNATIEIYESYIMSFYVLVGQLILFQTTKVVDDEHCSFTIAAN